MGRRKDAFSSARKHGKRNNISCGRYIYNAWLRCHVDLSAHSFPSNMLGRIRDQASLNLSKISLDTGGHVYCIHDILARKFRVFWSGNLVVELCCSSRWREMSLAKKGIAVQVVSGATLMLINHNRCVTKRHSSVSHKEKNIIRHLKKEFCNHVVLMEEEVNYWVTSHRGVY
jgi:hypothetical protein